MSVRQFRLVAAGELTQEQADLLFDRAGDVCVEVLPAGPGAAGLADDGAGPGPVGWVAFDREAPTLIDAVVSGVRDLDVAGIVPCRAAADDPVVTTATVAERIGRPVEVVRAWDLPAPLWPHPRRPVYAWPEVEAWLRDHRAYAPPDETVTLRAVTLALRLRALLPRLERAAPIRSLLVT